MILKNYWRWLGACMKYANVEADRINVGLVDMTGTALTTTPFGKGSNSYAPINQSFETKIFTRFGTGSTEPTSDDYALSSDVTSSFTGMTYSVATDTVTNLKRTITVNATNNTASDIEITQVGIGKQIYNGYSDSDLKNVLFGVVTLSTPITVGAGDSATIVFEWVES